MSRSRLLLLVSSLAVVLFLLGSGAALKAGAGEGSFRQMLLFSEILSYVVDNYVDPVDNEKLMRGADVGLMGGLDAHGAYLTQEEVESWKRGAGSTDVADPGVSVLKSGPVVQVVAVASGSPADALGIAPGDQIRKIAGHSVRSLSLDQAQRLLKGAPGSSVEIDLFRVKDLKREVVSIGRAARRDPPYVLDLAGNVAVLKVRDLDRLPTDELVTELGAIKDRGADRLLVDLRDAASLDTRHAAGIADLFVSGDFLRLNDRNGRTVEKLTGSRPKPAWAGKLAVLVNGATAGSGEGLAMILKDRKGAAIYGEPTYGLGTEPKLIELAEGDGLLVPGYVWETPAGKRWNADGLAPDKIVKNDGHRAERAADRGKDATAEGPIPERVVKPAPVGGDADDDQLKKTLDDFGKTDAAEASPKAA
jgi:carboxyl-terminal processing protease